MALFMLCGGRSGLGLVFIVETLLLFVMGYLFAMTTCYGLFVYFGLVQGVSVVGCVELVLFIALCSILCSPLSNGMRFVVRDILPYIRCWG